MIEHGNIRIRKKIPMKELFDELGRIANDMGEEYKIAYGSIDADGYFLGPRKVRVEGTEVMVGVKELSSLRVHFGTKVGIIICRNMKKKITLLVIRKSQQVTDEDINKIVGHLVEFTGGNFNAGI